MASDVHLVHLVRHRVQARWILCCEFEDLEGEESALVNLMMRTAGALGMLLLTQQPPIVLRVTQAFPELQWCQPVRPLCDTAGIMQI